MKPFASISKLKYGLVFINLCFASSALFANDDWVESENTSNFSAYVDKNTTKREQEFAIVRVLKNYVKPKTVNDVQKYRSQITNILYDCEKKIFNLLTTQLYELPWAKGTLIKSYDLKKQNSQQGWSPVKLGSIEEAFMELGCDGLSSLPITRVIYPAW
jgi:hypothetical protein